MPDYLGSDSKDGAILELDHLLGKHLFPGSAGDPNEGCLGVWGL